LHIWVLSIDDSVDVSVLGICIIQLLSIFRELYYPFSLDPRDSLFFSVAVITSKHTGQLSGSSAGKGDELSTASGT